MKFDRISWILILAFFFSLSILIYKNHWTPENQQIPTKPLVESGTDLLMRNVKEQNAQWAIVNFWATWCKPCVKEVPALLSLQNKYASQGVKLLFVSLDEAEDKKQVQRFVEEHVGMKNLTLESNGDQVISLLFTNWQGMIPVTLIFDSQANVVRSVEGTRSYQDFEKIIQKLLQH